jgi:hypothetical protein
MKFALIPFFLCSSLCLGQNLIKNPGFEDIECGKAVGKTGLYIKVKDQVCKIKDWDRPTQTRFDFSVNDTSNNPKTGNVCLGFNAYGFGSKAAREYLIGQITTPLTEGKTYIFRMHVKLAKNSTHMVSNIGAYFTADRVNMSGASVLPYQPQVKNKLHAKDYVSNSHIKAPKDLITWSGDNDLLIEGSFLAYGGEKYVVIGNFDNEKNIESTSLFDYAKKQQKTWSYFLVDDVSLEEDPSVPLTQIKKPLFPKQEIKPGNTLSLRELNFDQNSSMLTPKAGESLVKLADFLNEHPGMII